MKRLCLFLLVVVFVGCSDPKQNENVLMWLEKGEATGHVVITTDVAGEFAMEQRFRLGAAGTRVSFDGQINFKNVPAMP